MFREPVFQFLDLLLGQGEQIRVGFGFGDDAVPKLLCEPNALAGRQLQDLRFEFLYAHDFTSGWVQAEIYVQNRKNARCVL